MTKVDTQHHKEMGEYLKDCREGQGLKIDEISKNLNIRERYIKAIESGELDVLPGTIYTEGYLKSYAQYLKLDPRDIMKRYRNGSGANDDKSPEVEEEIQPMRHEKKPAPVSFKLPTQQFRDLLRPSASILAISAIAIIVAYAWWYISQNNYGQEETAVVKDPSVIEAEVMSEEDLAVIGVRTGRLGLSDVGNMEMLSGMDADSGYSIPGVAADSAQTPLETELPEKAKQAKVENANWANPDSQKKAAETQESDVKPAASKPAAAKTEEAKKPEEETPRRNYNRRSSAN